MREQEVSLPPPMVRTTDPAEIAWNQRLERHIAGCLAHDIAAAYDLDVRDVWTAMGTLPVESFLLFESPEGHAEIARYVVTNLTQERPTFALVPTVH
jgi:hypothetical protein